MSATSIQLETAKQEIAGILDEYTHASHTAQFANNRWEITFDQTDAAQRFYSRIYYALRSKKSPLPAGLTVDKTPHTSTIALTLT
jgi:hypothetical protein